MKHFFTPIAIAAALAATFAASHLYKPATLPASVYPLSGVVVCVDYPADMVTFRTQNGHYYCIRGCDDWATGDVIACIMDNNNTPHDVTDDIVLQSRYCGWVN